MTNTAADETRSMAGEAFAHARTAIHKGRAAEARTWLKLISELELFERTQAERIEPPEAADDEPEEVTRETKASAQRTPAPMDEIRRKHQRLKNLARSGRATPMELMALKELRTALRGGDGRIIASG